MFSSFLQFYLETDSWLWPFIAVTSLGSFWIYHRRVLSKLTKQRQELIENEHWLHEAQQIGNIGSWYRDLATGKSRWSPQLHRIYDLPEDLKPGFEKFCDVIHSDDREEVVNAIKQVEKTGESTVLEFRVKRSDDSITYVENRINGVFDENHLLVAVYGSVLEVTERKAYEDSLKQVIEEAESANKAKGAFLSSVSHEIRTPLNAIIGFSTLMSEQELTEEQYRFYGESIKAAGKSLSALINDILDLSALESLSFSLVPLKVDIRRIMEDVASVFKLIVSGKGISLNMKIDENIPLVKIDGKRLRQILINIIGNAVKFTEEGSVDVSVSVDHNNEIKTDCDLIFTISDSGIGISPIDHSRIFREFEQARGEVNRRFGGSGLGLSIVTQLLELMEGTIELESEVAKGSTFTVKFYNVSLADKHDSPEEIDESSIAERFEGEYASSVVGLSDKPAPDIDSLGLDNEALEELRHAFRPRFVMLSRGVNIEFARKLSADVYSWAVRKEDDSLIRFSKDLFTCTSGMNVGELLKMSSLVAGEHDL